MRDWSKWFVFKKKPYSIGNVIYRGPSRGPIILFTVAIAAIAIPAAALAKGPIVRAAETVWGAVLSFLGL